LLDSPLVEIQERGDFADVNGWHRARTLRTE
jgi:hypothetical protein